MHQIRTASSTWSGDLLTGSGMITSVTSGSIARLPVSWAARTEDHGGKTSPEELLAAAHTSCYAMQLSALIGEAGGTPVALQVSADVTLAPDPAGGFHLTGIALTVRGEVEGLDAAGFATAAAAAKATCPISKALTGVAISLDAALD